MVLMLVVAMWMAVQQHGAHAGDDRPATLMVGLGKLNHPIATSSREAQQFFNQGLTFVYGFNHDEAIRSFRRAAELDPASPLPRTTRRRRRSRFRRARRPAVSRVEA